MGEVSWRALFAEAIGTALLVYLAVGTATISFGFKLAGTSKSAGVIATALAFGLVLMGLVYAVGPISGCHINPAVTIGFLAARRISFRAAVSYWVAQVVGGIAGAAALYGTFQTTTGYKPSKQGLGVDGYGASSMIGARAGTAFIVEVILTFIFVLVVLATTRRSSNAIVAGLAIGLSLTLVHLLGIPVDGMSVNPARSIGPALMVGGEALSQIWLFIVAPLVGGILSALVYLLLYPAGEEEAVVEPAPQEQAVAPPRA